MNVLKNKKGAALLWVILLGIVSSILLASILSASYAFYNYTIYTTKRQQAYFTARSAVNILLEEFAAEEQEHQTSTAAQTATINGQSMKINQDGNYIVSTSYQKVYNGKCSAFETSSGVKAERGDTITITPGSIVDYNGDLVDFTHGGRTFPLLSYYITSTGYAYDVKSDSDSLLGIGGKYIKRLSTSSGMLVRKEVQGIGSYITSSNISVLPEKNQTLVVSDFVFDSSLNMGAAEATIARGDDDVVTIDVTAYYPSRDNGEEYKIKATVERQPLYFGGIAVKHLKLDGNLTLGANTDLYWNNTSIFDTTGHSGDVINNGNNKLTIQGNLVTKGDAKLGAGTIVANRNFYEDATFNNDTARHSRKIWSATEYVISNKTLTVGDDASTEYTETTVNKFKRLANNSTKLIMCNNFDTDFFGTAPGDIISSILNKASGFASYGDIADEQLALRDDINADALSIKYIEILSLSAGINNYIEEQSGLSSLVLEGIQSAFDSSIALNHWYTPARPTTRDQQKYNVMDVSYIDFASTDEFNRSDEVTPVFYLFLTGGDAEACTLRIRYGNVPDRRTNLFSTFQSIKDNLEQVISSAFDIHESPSYGVIYLEKGATLELGTPAKNNETSAMISTNPNDYIFMYSIYGQEGSKVILHDGVTLVGEIMVDDLEVDGGPRGVNVVYSSTSGSQVAKQKIAEYWTVSGYKEG